MDFLNDEDRLNNLIEVISGMAGLDFSQKALVDESDNPLNTIALGINMLAEELESSVVSRSELEAQNEELERLTREQEGALLEMSTPIAQLWEGILLLPLVGFMDAKRAEDVLHTVLHEIARSQAKIFILDISGVTVVDTFVANHFIKIAKATRLMGCRSILSGITPAVSQTIVDLGIDIDKLKTTGSMKDALDYAFRQTGFQLERQDEEED